MEEPIRAYRSDEYLIKDHTHRQFMYAITYWHKIRNNRIGNCHYYIRHKNAKIIYTKFTKAFLDINKILSEDEAQGVREFAEQMSRND